MISFVSKGSTAKTEAFLRKIAHLNVMGILNAAGAEGVKALSAATPIDSGLAKGSWDYHVKPFRGGARITWTNSDIEDGYPVVIGIQYGHGTGTGGYVQGIDFINPAMKPIFDQIADKVWKAVTSA
jgi:hypothetical protein